MRPRWNAHTHTLACVNKHKSQTRTTVQNMLSTYVQYDEPNRQKDKLTNTHLAVHCMFLLHTPRSLFNDNQRRFLLKKLKFFFVKVLGHARTLQVPVQCACVCMKLTAGFDPRRFRDLAEFLFACPHIFLALSYDTVQHLWGSPTLHNTGNGQWGVKF